MNKQTFLSRLSVSGISNRSISHNIIRTLLSQDTLRPVFLKGSGRHTSNDDRRLEIETALKSMKIDFEVGNDAPRGGLTGSFIQLTAKGKKQMATARKEHLQELEAEANAKKQAEIDKLAPMVEFAKANPQILEEFEKKHGDLYYDRTVQKFWFFKSRDNNFTGPAKDLYLAFEHVYGRK